MKFNKINSMIWWPALVVLLVSTSSCDWTSGGGVDSWNERWNWVNFSGVYRGVGGFAVGGLNTSGGAGSGGDATVPDSQNFGVGNGGSVYTGTLRNTPIVPGSVTIVIGPGSYRDGDGSGILTGPLAGTTASTVNYSTGAWRVDVGVPVGSDQSISASYRYTPSVPDGSGSGAGGISISSFTVFQEGEQLRITDNNGATYNGRMGSIRSSTGFSGQGAPPAGDTVTAQFTAKGISKAGREVEMVGTFSGVLNPTTADRVALINRRMEGTWIESGRGRGNIDAATGPINLTIVPTSTPGSAE